MATAASSLAKRMERVKPSAIRELLRLGADPSIVSFGGGYPDVSLLPADDLSQVFRMAFEEQAALALQYNASAGLPRLREQIAVRTAADGAPCSAAEVLIVQGAQQGLDLIARLLLDEGDLVVTENPTFLGALIAFNPYQPRYAAVQIDADGIDVNALETLLRRERPKLLYLMPDFQNPTGVSMSVERRRAVIQLANRHDLLIVEDTPYRQLRYAGEHRPTLRSLDTEGRVFHVGTFSKILAPALRTGWIAAPAALIAQLELLKLAADTQCSTLNMVAVSLYLERCDIDRSLAAMAALYGRKKDLMLETIRASFPADVRFSQPEGGLFTWLTFPDGFDAARFMAEQALPRAKVAYVPGATFFPVVEETNHARMSFATQSEDAIVRGVGALGALLRETL
jgi:2-aminoadipate transaminase